jgi:dTDP-4-amino-4,6-dideoxygalactose transaminase
MIAKNQACSISRDIASRILRLPIYPGLNVETQKAITQVIKEVL